MLTVVENVCGVTRTPARPHVRRACIEAEGWHVNNPVQLLMHVAAIVKETKLSVALQIPLSLPVCTFKDTRKSPNL